MRLKHTVWETALLFFDEGLAKWVINEEAVDFLHGVQSIQVSQLIKSQQRLMLIALPLGSLCERPFLNLVHSPIKDRKSAILTAA